jgi:hypothetical protein
MKGKKLTVYLSMIAFMEAALLSILGLQRSTEPDGIWLHSAAIALLVAVIWMYGLILVRIKKQKK